MTDPQKSPDPTSIRIVATEGPRRLTAKDLCDHLLKAEPRSESEAAATSCADGYDPHVYDEYNRRREWEASKPRRYVGRALVVLLVVVGVVVGIGFGLVVYFLWQLIGSLGGPGGW